MPVIRALRRERKNTGGTDCAEYCYSVFLRHYKSGARNNPMSVLELGPGDTIGIGLCWLIAGAERYIALDAQRYASAERSLAIFEQLVELFRSRAAVPDVQDVKPFLADDAFPEGLNPDLSVERLDAIRESIRTMSGQIAYIAPWSADAPIPEGSIDLAYSQAVLEHVTDLENTYAALGRWVTRGGLMSHQIDLRSHGTSFDLNGHWAYSQAQWKRANNRQTYRAINRAPASTHLELIERASFKILSTQRVETQDGIGVSDVAQDWGALSFSDVICTGVHVLAVKE